MHHVEFRAAIDRAGFPVARNAAADADDSAQAIRMCERKAIVERARLREAEQKYTGRIRDTFISQSLDQIKQRPMMNRDGFFAAKIAYPAEAEAQWPTGFARLSNVLVKALQRRD